ncbi:MAG: 50S ribosomal protein L19 [bacterium]
MTRLVEKINKTSLKPDSFSDSIVVGNTVDVHVKVSESGKDRIQVFTGTILARKGHGSTETFTVRRISHGVGVERIFPVHSPYVVKIDMVKSGRVRRAKLYYLRELGGKKAKLREAVRAEQQ